GGLRRARLRRRRPPGTARHTWRGALRHRPGARAGAAAAARRLRAGARRQPPRTARGHPVPARRSRGCGSVRARTAAGAGNRRRPGHVAGDVVVNYWPLLGIAIVVAGFVLRYNPVLVVVVAGLASGLLAGMTPGELLALLGESFVGSRALLLYVLTLPAIGVLERAGLREHVHAWILGLRGMTLARLLTSYLGLRQLLSMVGLTHVGGHAQTVRPRLAPMAEAAAEKTVGQVSEDERQQVLAMSAATDNVGLFFGEDVFVAIGAVLLIQGFYAEYGIVLEPLQIALWALPTAFAAFAIHALRIVLFQRALRSRGG